MAATDTAVADRPAVSVSITYGTGAEEAWMDAVTAILDRGIVVAVNGRDYLGLGVSTNAAGQGCLQLEVFDADRGEGTLEVVEIPWADVDNVHVY